MPNQTPAFPVARSRSIFRTDPLFWWALGVSAITFACTLTYPFNNDNALYAYMADLSLHGKLPYVGSWDQNFPAIVLIHAVQILLFGHSQFAFHLFDILLQLIGSFFLYRIGEVLYSKWAGALLAVLASLYYVQQGLWMSGERDTYVTIVVLAALYFTIHGRRALLAGLLTGFAFLFRPTYGLYPVVFILYFIAAQPKGRLWAQCLIGAVIPTLVLILIYWLAGGLRELWEATILFNLKVYGGVGAAFSFWEPIRFYWLSVIPALAGMWYLYKKDRATTVLIAGLFVASLISLIVLYRHSVYHYHPAMTVFLLFSAIGWCMIVDRVHGVWLRRAVLIAIIGFYAFQTFRGNTVQHVIAGFAEGKIHTLAESYSMYEGSPDFGTAVQTEVGAYLKAHTKPGEDVQMFGPYSYPQYFAGLGSTSRFQTLHALAMRGKTDSLQDFQIRWRREYLNDLSRHPPIYFIVCDAPEAFRQYYSGRLGHEILRQDFTELGRWLDSNYYPETKIGAFTLYRIRPTVFPKP